MVAFLAIMIAAILIAPQVDLDPVAPRLEWAACLVIVFLTWLATLANLCLMRAMEQQSSNQRAGLPTSLLSAAPLSGRVQLRC